MADATNLKTVPTRKERTSSFAVCCMQLTKQTHFLTLPLFFFRVRRRLSLALALQHGTTCIASADYHAFMKLTGKIGRENNRSQLWPAANSQEPTDVATK